MSVSQMSIGTREVAAVAAATEFSRPVATTTRFNFICRRTPKNEGVLLSTNNPNKPKSIVHSKTTQIR